MQWYTKYYSKVKGRFKSALPIASTLDTVTLQCEFADEDQEGFLVNIVYKDITVSWNRLLAALDDGIIVSYRLVDKYAVD